MVHSFDDVPMLWRCHAVLAMIHMRQHAIDPDEEFREWVDDANEHMLQAYIDFAFASWAEVRTWNQGECEEQRAIMGNVLRELESR